MIELPIIAGPNHPSNNHDRRGRYERKDSACITLDWEAQRRTNMRLDTYERTRRRKRSRLQHLSRAIRKKMCVRFVIIFIYCDGFEDDQPHIILIILFL